MPDSNEITRLLNDYADGQIKPKDEERLLRILDESTEHRELLALVTVVERLIKASRCKPVPVEKILAALPKNFNTMKEIREQENNQQSNRKKYLIRGKKTTDKIKKTKHDIRNRTQSRYQKNSVASLLAAATICILLGIGAWRLFPRVSLPDKKIMTPSKPVASEQTELKLKPVTNATDTPPSPVSARLPDIRQLSISEINEVEPVNLPAPEGDGSNEKGFVPPPQGLKKHNAETQAQLSPRFADDRSGKIARTIFKSEPKSQVLVLKLKRGSNLQWNATPNDVDNLLNELNSLFGIKYLSDSASFDAMDADPAKYPIIYYSGHYRFRFSHAERKKLRAYMLGGGMILFNAGLGSKPFYDSAILELQCIFPDISLQPLDTDHPIFHSCFDLAQIKYFQQTKIAKTKAVAPRFYGIMSNCRTMALVSQYCLSIGWEGIENNDYQAYAVEDALKLGINIVSYAIAQKAWLQNIPREPWPTMPATKSDTLHVAQIIYNGEWKTRTMGLPLLLHTFNKKTNVKVALSVKNMHLTDPEIFDAPILYITGHDDFYFSKQEAMQLREFLRNGGFLFAEACCGRQGFDRAFRAEMERVLPEEKMEKIAADSAIYRMPNKITRIGLTPSLAAKIGSSVSTPMLEGIAIENNYVVVYSRYGMAGGWEMSQNPYADGYDNVGSTKLGQNILMYAITH
ncbi:MAG: DUF4159 domain-containing protein [Lentisphaerae bacterium]|nr:DUF4159 domain-containing protein [Lentisphaerota bacterium]